MMVEAVLPSAISGIVGLGVWFLLRKPLEDWTRRTERLEAEVIALRDERVKTLDDRQHEIGSQLTDVRTHFVHKQECAAVHEKLAGEVAGIYAAGREIEGLTAKVENAVKFVSEVNARQIGLMQDLARIEGRLNGKR